MQRRGPSRLKDYWEEYLDNLYARNPDEDMNLFVNTWNQYQCKDYFQLVKVCVHVPAWPWKKEWETVTAHRDTLRVMDQSPNRQVSCFKN